MSGSADRLFKVIVQSYWTSQARLIVKIDPKMKAIISTQMGDIHYTGTCTQYI
jgi:hypothetical protein